MKLTAKHIAFAVMILMILTALITGILVLCRVLEFFRPATDVQLATQSTEQSAGDTTTQPEGPTVPSHVHTFVEEKSYDATCDGSGYTRYVCECGKADIRDLTDPLGHIYGEPTDVAPTCETDGYTERVCSRCHNSEYTNIIPASHDFDDWTSTGAAPQEWHTCAVCYTMEIRSTDMTQVWRLRLPLWENTGSYYLQKAILEVDATTEETVYNIYLDGSVAVTGYDYADGSLSLFYTVNGVRGDFTFTEGITTVTILGDGTAIPEAPETPENE